MHCTNLNLENKIYFNKQKSYCFSLLRKAKVQYFGNRDTKTLCHSKRFWSSFKPVFFGKVSRKNKIILLEKDEKPEAEEIAEYKQMVSKILNNFFSRFIAYLNLSPYIDALINTENVEDPVLKAKMKFLNNPSIKAIKGRFPRNRFSFNKVTKSDIRKEKINLNNVKALQGSDIPTKLSK